MNPLEEPFLEMRMSLPGGRTEILRLDKPSAREALAELENWGNDCSPECKDLRDALRKKFEEEPLDQSPSQLPKVKTPFPIETLMPKGTCFEISLLHPQDFEMFPILPKETLETGWMIHALFLPEEHRNQGLGTKLLQEAIAAASSQQKTLFLHAYPTQPRSTFQEEQTRLITHYQSLGFTLTTDGWMFKLP